MGLFYRDLGARWLHDDSRGHRKRKTVERGLEDFCGARPKIFVRTGKGWECSVFRSLSRSGKGWECSAGSAPIIINGLGTCVLRLRRACLSANQTLSHRSRGDTVTHSLTTRMIAYVASASCLVGRHQSQLCPHRKLKDGTKSASSSRPGNRPT